MVSRMQRQKSIVWSIILCSLSLLIISCSGGGDNGPVPAVPEPSARSAKQAVKKLLDIYGTAVRQEDIDRLQTLLPPEAPPVVETLLRQQIPQRQSDHGLRMDAQSFRNRMSEDFRGLIILDFYCSIPDEETDCSIPDEGIEATPDFATATFQEVRSVEDPSRLEQRTHVINTTLELIGNKTDGVITFLISEVLRDGPQFEIITPGQIWAGIPSPITVSEKTGTFPLDEVEIEVLDSEILPATQMLSRDDGMFHGFFTPPMQSDPKPLRVHLRSVNQEVVVLHRYRLRMPGDGVVELIGGTQIVDFYALAIAPDGTVWAGGKYYTPLTGTVITVFRVLPGESRAMSSKNFLSDPNGLITDMVFDRLGRLHVVLFATQSQSDGAQPGAGVLFNLEQSDLSQLKLCQTVNVFDSDYPFVVEDLRGELVSEELQILPSPSTRAIAAGRGDIWLFGSDGGIARVVDDFREEQCSEVNVSYPDEDFYSRESGLPSNTVTAVVESMDGSIWFGTSSGLTILQNERLVPVFFSPPSRPSRNIFLNLEDIRTLEELLQELARGNPNAGIRLVDLDGEERCAVTLDISPDGEERCAVTLEAFFQAVANAIFDSRPLTDITIGDLSILEEFGRPLSKEDTIFSAIEETPGRLWVGTLGGGLRRVDVTQDGPEDTLWLTRKEGLGSNIIFALTVERDGVVWAATDEGVSRLETAEEPIRITNFSALDGLKTPVRDLAVDADGTLWLATGRGLYRIVQQDGLVQGNVQTSR